MGRRGPRAYIALVLAIPLLVIHPIPPPPVPTSALVIEDISPDGGETFNADDVTTLAWNASHDADTWFWATLSYDAGGGAGGFITRGDFPLRNGTYPFRLPRWNTTAERVQVCGIAPDGDSACRESAANFTVLATPPYLDLLSPRDGAANLPLEAPLVFGLEAVDAASVRVDVDPLVFGWSMMWSNGDRILAMAHATPLATCAMYNVTANATATDGTPLGPYVWSFTTTCPPKLVDIGIPTTLTDPLVLYFDRPMASVTWDLVPASPRTSSWLGHNTILVISPSPGWWSCTMYTFFLSGALDFDGNDLGPPGPIPNPFSFATWCGPYIVSTDPADGQTIVGIWDPITVVFSAPLDLMKPFELRLEPAPTPPYVYDWSGGNTVLTFQHQGLVPCTVYTATVIHPDLVPGPVPNPWSFSTGCSPFSPAGLRIERLAPDAIRLTWNAAPPASLYRVYESPDRLAPFPWSLLAETPNMTLDVPGHLNDGSPHYYLIRGVWQGTEGANSTMASKVEADVQFDPLGTNVHWFSLSYRSEYRSASDISDELTASNIDVVGKWDAAARRSVLWFYLRGGWRGTDFSIDAGDALFIGAVRSFPWALVGTDSALPVSFLAFSPVRFQWTSVPHTSPYVTASDLVRDIEGSVNGSANTKIVEVSAWDSGTQTLVRYYWTPSGWTGEDFVVAPGNAVAFSVVADFAWQPALLTPEVP